MNTVSRDFVTVDMRGLKAPLEALARRERKSVSELVRTAVSERWVLPASAVTSDEVRVTGRGQAGAGTVKVSIRLTRGEVQALEARRHQSGLSRGVLIAGLLADVAVLKGEARYVEHLSALAASNAEMATLCRYIAHLGQLLREEEWPAAREYRSTLESLAGDVRRHLALAAAELKALQPARGVAHPTRKGM
jgi:hypothetical protein